MLAWELVRKNITLMSEQIWNINQESTNPLLSLDFDRVCMYDYDNEPATGWDDLLIVKKDGMLTTAENIKQVVELDSLTTKELVHMLGDSKSYGDDIMRCFIPHLAFIFYRGTEIVFHVSICLTCNNLRPSIAIPAHTAGRGMTILFRTFLNDLLDKHGFSHNVRWEE